MDYNSPAFKVNLPQGRSNIIKVIGVGGGGGNAVSYMYDKGIKGVDFFVANTDSQALEKSNVPNRIHLGASLSEGLGAGSDPEVGRACALESKKQIQEALDTNTKMLFITAGMGGGTGTGAAPVIAEIARSLGILTVAIVTTPFKSEGPHRNNQAKEGLEALKPHVDAMLLITNDRILQMYHNLRYSEAFSKADNVLCTAAKGIAEIITVAGKMNVDFRDVKTAMTNSGRAIMGTGVSSDDDRALAASQQALESPLLDNTNIVGAKHILLNISFENSEPYAQEIEHILDFFQTAAGSNAILKFGITQTEGIGDALAVTVIATGFDQYNDENEVVMPEENMLQIDNETEGPIEIDFDSPSDSLQFEQPKDLFGKDTNNQDLNHAFQQQNNPVNGFQNNPSFPPQYLANFDNSGANPPPKNNPPANPINDHSLDTPAYLRMGVVLDPLVDDKNMHKLYLDEKQDEPKFKENGNKFLHKNAD
jgi:cell division protein FtsZ